MSAMPPLLPETRGQETTRHEEERTSRNWASARTILDALILAGILWIVSSQLDSQRQAASDRLTARVQTATIIAQIASIQYNITDVPALRDTVAHNTERLNDLTRRMDANDAETLRLGRGHSQ